MLRQCMFKSSGKVVKNKFKYSALTKKNVTKYTINCNKILHRFGMSVTKNRKTI